MGLTICSIIVKALSKKGELNIKSDIETGSTFSFNIDDQMNEFKGIYIRKSLFFG